MFKRFFCQNLWRWTSISLNPKKTPSSILSAQVRWVRKTNGSGWEISAVSPSNNDLFLCEEHLSVKTSQGELKEHYLETGRCEAMYLAVACRPTLAQLWAVSVWRWGGSFPHWGTKALWLRLVLLLRAGLAGQFCPSVCAAYNKHQHSGGWEASPLEYTADLTECQTEFAAHPFLPQSMVPLTGKAICVTAFLS